MNLSLTHLTAEQFEELCFDLVLEMGAQHVSWRKGTALTGSPSDQGRDIESEFSYAVPGGEVLTERRFIECKHYSKGVPPSALSAALTWAQAERPDTLYFLISGFLSNGAKESLRRFQAENRPPFRVIVWERPDILARVQRHSRLLVKYGLAGRPPQLDLLHPAHLEFIITSPVRRLETLFGILDKLEPRERDEHLAWVRESIVMPRYRRPAHQKESVADLRLDPVDYQTFKQKCYAMPIEEHLLVQCIIGASAQAMFRIGDYTRADEVKANLRGLIEFLKARAAPAGGSAEPLGSIVARSEGDLATADQRLNANYERYQLFCEQVVRPLLDARETLEIPSFLR